MGQFEEFSFFKLKIINQDRQIVKKLVHDANHKFKYVSGLTARVKTAQEFGVNHDNRSSYLLRTWRRFARDAAREELRPLGIIVLNQIFLKEASVLVDARKTGDQPVQGRVDPQIGRILAIGNKADIIRYSEGVISGGVRLSFPVAYDWMCSNFSKLNGAHFVELMAEAYASWVTIEGVRSKFPTAPTRAQDFVITSGYRFSQNLIAVVKKGYISSSPKSGIETAVI